MASLTRVQSSLELLCQTAGALEEQAKDHVGAVIPKESSRESNVNHHLMPRVSPTNLGGGASRTAQNQSPFGGCSFTNDSRANSSQYLVGASPSHDSFSGLEEEDEDPSSVSVPNRQWGDGHVISVRENYLDALRYSNREPHGREHFPTTFVPGRSSSTFYQPTTSFLGSNGPPARGTSLPIYVGCDKSAPINQMDSFLTLTPPNPNVGGEADQSRSMDELVSENARLRSEATAKDRHIEMLLARLKDLQGQVNSLKSLPVGKISQIPLDDLLEIMREYGSEVSGHALPPRKGEVQKASVVRQFRRWNPNFFDFFEHRNGRWVPKLGKKAELERRERARQAPHKAASSGDGRRSIKSSKRRVQSYK